MPTHAHDPDAIVLEPCSQADATLQLMLSPMARYIEAVRRNGFRGCDELTQPIVHAIAGGREMPDEFTILDTYYDIGAPEVEERCQRIRREVRSIIAAAGIPMRTTFTMLDGGAA